MKSVPSVLPNSFSTVAAIATATSTEVPSSSRIEEPATSAASEVTGEPSSATPAADPQPISPSQEEVTASVAAVAAAAEVSTNNEAPAADDTVAAQQQQSEQSNSSEDNEPKTDNTDAVTVATATGENTGSAQLTALSHVSTNSESTNSESTGGEPAGSDFTGEEPTNSVAVPIEEVKELGVTDHANIDLSESSSEATLFESSTDAAISTGPPHETDFGKSEQIQSSPSPDTGK